MDLTNPPVQSSDRFIRQQALIPQARLANLKASVIGVGAIGRQVALQLASIGVCQIQLVDFDTVELHNVTTQGFLSGEIGQPKVKATADAILKIDPSIKIEMSQDRFRPKLETGDAVFCCVDKISSRAAIWKHLEDRTEIWTDGRMLGEVIRVLTATDLDSRRQYRNSLFRQSDALTGTCTSHSSIYAASIAAGLMIHQFSRWLRGLPLDRDLIFNLLSSEMIVS